MTENFYISLIFCSCICVCFLIDYLFRMRDKKRLQKKASKLLRKLEDIRMNDSIIATVNFLRNGDIVTKNTSIHVLNNNPFDKKIFVRIPFVNNEGKNDYEDRVYLYSDDIFRHFTTLNPLNPITTNTVKGLFQDELNSAIEQQEYEIAAIIRDAISKIENLKKEEVINDVK